MFSQEFLGRLLELRTDLLSLLPLLNLDQSNSTTSNTNLTDPTFQWIQITVFQTLDKTAPLLRSNKFNFSVPIILITSLLQAHIALILKWFVCWRVWQMLLDSKSENCIQPNSPGTFSLLPSLSINEILESLIVYNMSPSWRAIYSLTRYNHVYLPFTTLVSAVQCGEFYKSCF